jgi:hypothetical protein
MARIRSKTTARQRRKMGPGKLIADTRTAAQKAAAAKKTAAPTRVKSTATSFTSSSSKGGTGKKTKKNFSQQFRKKASSESKHKLSTSTSTSNTNKRGKTNIRKTFVHTDKDTGKTVASKQRTNKRGVTRETVVKGKRAAKAGARWAKQDLKKAGRQKKRSAKK